MQKIFDLREVIAGDQHLKLSAKIQAVVSVHSTGKESALTDTELGVLLGVKILGLEPHIDFKILVVLTVAANVREGDAVELPGSGQTEVPRLGVHGYRQIIEAVPLADGDGGIALYSIVKGKNVHRKRTLGNAQKNGCAF